MGSRRGLGTVGSLAGALLNAAVQVSAYWHNNLQEATWAECLRQFSWLMMLVSAGFFGLIGFLYQRRLDEREEAVEIEATLQAKQARAARGRVDER